MEGFLVATGVVALAEIGDKTQLLALLLATRVVVMAAGRGVRQVHLTITHTGAMAMAVVVMEG